MNEIKRENEKTNLYHQRGKEILTSIRRNPKDCKLYKFTQIPINLMNELKDLNNIINYGHGILLNIEHIREYIILIYTEENREIMEIRQTHTEKQDCITISFSLTKKVKRKDKDNKIEKYNYILPCTECVLIERPISICQTNKIVMANNLSTNFQVIDSLQHK